MKKSERMGLPKLPAMPFTNFVYLHAKLEVKRLHDMGYSQTEIAEAYGVRQMAISNAIKDIKIHTDL